MRSAPLVAAAFLAFCLAVSALAIWALPDRENARKEMVQAAFEGGYSCAHYLDLSYEACKIKYPSIFK